MGVDLEAAGPAEGFAAGLADVSVLGLGEGGLGGRADVVVVLPRVGRSGECRRGGLLHGCWVWRRRRRWWEVGGERALLVHG